MAIHVRDIKKPNTALCGRTLNDFQVTYIDIEHLVATVRANSGMRAPDGWACWCKDCYRVAKKESDGQEGTE